MSERREGMAAGISLWLVPDGAAYELLAARIHALAASHGGPIFPPHVTLLGGLPDEAEQVVASACRLAGSMPRVLVRLVSARVRDEYFRRLVLEAEPTPPLMEARAEALRALEVAAGRYEPHLSLFYGRVDVREADAGVEMPLVLTCRRLTVWRTEGTVESWRPLGSAELAPGSR